MSDDHANEGGGRGSQFTLGSRVSVNVWRVGACACACACACAYASVFGGLCGPGKWCGPREGLGFMSQKEGRASKAERQRTKRLFLLLLCVPTRMSECGLWFAECWMLSRECLQSGMRLRWKMEVMQNGSKLERK